jgi:hypothetical protein
MPGPAGSHRHAPAPRGALSRAQNLVPARLGRADGDQQTDELGFVPFDRAGGELLFQLFSERSERRSTIVTTNLAFSEGVQVFGDEKLTVALLDRLGHHAHVLTTRGESYRTRKLRGERAE